MAFAEHLEIDVSPETTAEVAWDAVARGEVGLGQCCLARGRWGVDRRWRCQDCASVFAL